MPMQGYTLPAPGGGLNLIDGDMVGTIPENEAIVLTNLFPIRSDAVELRGGVQDFCDTSESAVIKALYALRLKNGSDSLVACVNNTFQEVSTGTASDVTGSTTPTSDEWCGEVFNNKLYLANGANTVQVWNGSTMSDATYTGVTLATLNNVASYKERIYFVEKDSTSAWYGGTSSESGALTEFDVGYYLNKGGSLFFAGSFTDKQGDAATDLFMFASSEGELLFYSGSYPGDSAWTLVAKYLVGRPLNRRSFVRVDNDLWIITEQGIVPVSLLFSGGPTVALNALSRKVNKRIQQYASQVNNFLWHGVHWAMGKRVYIIIPITASTARMLAINTETGAWCDYEFSGGNLALSAEIMAGTPYVGDDAGVVRTLEQNNSDDGSAISFEMKLPYHFFGSRNNFKAFKEIRPLIRTAAGLTMNVGIDTDFKELPLSATITTGTGTSTPWGSAWGSSWAAGTDYKFQRYSVSGQGHAGAIRVSGSAENTPLVFNAFEVRFNVGGQV